MADGRGRRPPNPWVWLLAIALLALVAWGVGWLVHDGRPLEAEIGVTDEPSPRRHGGERPAEAGARRADSSRGPGGETAGPAAATSDQVDEPAAGEAPAADR
jgi:hypothetical protein